MSFMEGVVKDIASWLEEHGFGVFKSAVDEDGDGVLGFASPLYRGLRFLFVIQGEGDGLFFCTLRLVFADLEAPEGVLQAVTAQLKAVKAFLDQDGDVVLSVEAFTHDPHALPFVLPRWMTVLRDASVLLGFWKAMGGLLAPGR